MQHFVRLVKEETLIGHFQVRLVKYFKQLVVQGSLIQDWYSPNTESIHYWLLNQHFIQHLINIIGYLLSLNVGHSGSTAMRLDSA